MTPLVPPGSATYGRVHSGPIYFIFIENSGQIIGFYFRIRGRPAPYGEISDPPLLSYCLSLIQFLVLLVGFLSPLTGADPGFS